MNGCWMHRIEGYSIENGSKKFVQYAKDVVIAVMIEKKPLFDKLEDVLNMTDVDMRLPVRPLRLCHVHRPRWRLFQSQGARGGGAPIKLSLKYDKHPRAELGSNYTSGQTGFEKSLKRYSDLGVVDYCIGFDVWIILDWMRAYGGLTRKMLKMD